MYQKSMWSMFADCFHILVENLTLFWPFLFLLLIVQLFAAMGQDTDADIFNPVLLAMLLVFWGLLMAFFAGIYHMAYQAVWRKFNPPSDKTKPPSPFENLFLLKEFFPGVGGYFSAFFIGGLIQVLLLLGIKFGSDAVIEAWGGYPAPLLKLQAQVVQQNEFPTFEQMQQVVSRLSPVDINFMQNVSLLMMGLLSAYAVFSFLTMLWPAMVIAYDTSAVNAYFKSVRQFFKTPLLMLSIVFAYILVAVSIIQLFSMVGGFLGGLQGLFLLMANLWFMLLACYLVASVRKSEEPEGQIPEGSSQGGSGSGDKPEKDSTTKTDSDADEKPKSRISYDA